jgi:hypothetical protein
VEHMDQVLDIALFPIIPPTIRAKRAKPQSRTSEKDAKEKVDAPRPPNPKSPGEGQNPPGGKPGETISPIQPGA